MVLRFYGRNATGFLASICESLQEEICGSVRISHITVILDNYILEHRGDKQFQACPVVAKRERRKTSSASSKVGTKHTSDE